MTQAQTQPEQQPTTDGPPKSGLLQELIRANPTAVIPSNVLLSDYEEFGRHIRGLTSAMNKGSYSPADVQENMAKAMIGAERGIPMTTAIEALHLVEGRIMAGSWLLQALAEEEGWSFDWSSDDPCEDCTVTATHADHGERSFTFTLAMAYMMKGKQPGSGFRSQRGNPSNWDKTPWAMLYARAVSIVARRCCPRRLLGMYSPDELDDIRTPDDSTPRVGRHAFDAAAMKTAIADAAPEPTPEPEPDEPAEPAEPAEAAEAAEAARTPIITADALEGDDAWESQVTAIADAAGVSLDKAEAALQTTIGTLPRVPDDPGLRADMLNGTDWGQVLASMEDGETGALFDDADSK
jgi:hypothetical protein